MKYSINYQNWNQYSVQFPGSSQQWQRPVDHLAGALPGATRPGERSGGALGCLGMYSGTPVAGMDPG